MDKNYLNAYYCLNPKDLPKVKNNRFLNERDRKFVTYIIATYTVGLIIFLPVMVYLNLGQWLNYGFPILLLILFWPLVLYAYPQAIHNFYSGNLDLIFSYELSVIFLLLISLVLTIIISYLLSPKIFHYIENRENSESKNWLKIPSWE